MRQIRRKLWITFEKRFGQFSHRIWIGRKCADVFVKDPTYSKFLTRKAQPNMEEVYANIYLYYRYIAYTPKDDTGSMSE